jgi:hypothetical protein
MQAEAIEVNALLQEVDVVAGTAGYSEGLIGQLACCLWTGRQMSLQWLRWGAANSVSQ